MIFECTSKHKEVFLIEITKRPINVGLGRDLSLTMFLKSDRSLNRKSYWFIGWTYD